VGLDVCLCFPALPCRNKEALDHILFGDCIKGQGSKRTVAPMKESGNNIGDGFNGTLIEKHQ
jgi:hypothetical protein